MQQEVSVHRAFVTLTDARGWLFTPQPELSPAEWQHAVTAARACLAAPHPGVLPVLEVSDVQIVTAATPLRPLAELINRAGALEADALLTWIPAVADAAAHLGVALDPWMVLAGEGAAPLVLGFAVPQTPADPKAQVRALGGLFYEGLKGMPPPDTLAPGDWVGVKPKLAELLTEALTGAAASPAEWAARLRGLGSVETAGFATPAVPAAPRPAGEQVGAYVLEQRIATGGVGEVYLARHARLGRRVALKLLRPELAKETDLVRRFFEEARIVNEINHPHIVQISDFVEAQGVAYCVMELLEGRTLKQLVDDAGPLKVARSVALMRQVCQALQAAHKIGVVHRDIKPENVFVGPNDFVKVLDFGIAKQLRNAQGQTTLGTVMGTPFYMAPEQAQGRTVNARADLYAVGVVLWELLSGQSFDTVKGRPPLLATSATGEPIDERLALLVSLCLEPDQNARPASAEEVEKVLASATVAAPVGRPPPRSPLKAVGVGAMVLGLGLVAYGLRPRPAQVAAPIDGPPAVVAAPEPAPAPARPPLSPRVKAAIAPLAQDPVMRRVVKLKLEHQRLVAAHGADRLTSLEQAAFQQALIELRAGTVSKGTLEGAEAALASARTRLER